MVFVLLMTLVFAHLSPTEVKHARYIYPQTSQHAKNGKIKLRVM